MSMIVERIFHDQLQNHLDSQNILEPYKFGLHRSHSTTTVLVKLDDETRLAIDRRHITILILFDFTTAFDMVTC